MLRMIDLYLKPVHTKNVLLPDDSDLKLLLYRDLQQRSLTGPFVPQDAINLPPHSVAYDEHIELPLCFCIFTWSTHFQIFCTWICPLLHHPCQDKSEVMQVTGPGTQLVVLFWEVLRTWEMGMNRGN